MGIISQLSATSFKMVCCDRKLWSFVLLLSVMNWSTCHCADCDELYYSLDDIDEGITLAGCDTDPDNVKCIGMWAERTFINEEIEYYGKGGFGGLGGAHGGINPLMLSLLSCKEPATPCQKPNEGSNLCGKGATLPCCICTGKSLFGL